VSRIDGEALADCSIILVRLQRNCDRLVSSLCVAPRTSGHWQNVVVCRCSVHWPTYRLHLSCKYVGASPREIWYINTASLKSIRRLLQERWGFSSFIFIMEMFISMRLHKSA